MQCILAEGVKYIDMLANGSLRLHTHNIYGRLYALFFWLEVFLLGKVNIQNLRTPSTEEAREMQKKSAKKRSQNIKERKLIRQVIEERLGCADLDEIVDNLIDRAKHDSKDFEVLQAALGQKPIDKVQTTQTVVDMSAFSTEEIKAMLDEEV